MIQWFDWLFGPICAIVGIIPLSIAKSSGNDAAKQKRIWALAFWLALILLAGVPLIFTTTLMAMAYGVRHYLTFTALGLLVLIHANIWATRPRASPPRFRPLRAYAVSLGVSVLALLYASVRAPMLCPDGDPRAFVCEGAATAWVVPR
jgi:hypothetical protein